MFAEQLSGTAFTQPRAVNRRTWVYRIMPSAAHPKFSRIANGTLRGTPFDEIEPDPNRLRWDPLPMPGNDTDFIDGLYTVAGNGDIRTRAGMAVHQYAANQSMTSRYFVDSDGELALPVDESLEDIDEVEVEADDDTDDEDAEPVGAGDDDAPIDIED